MIVPNKFITLGESVLGNVYKMIEKKGTKISLADLYQKSSDIFDCADSFLYCLDVLYVLGMIDIDFDKKVVLYVS